MLLTNNVHLLRCASFCPDYTFVETNGCQWDQQLLLTVLQIDLKIHCTSLIVCSLQYMYYSVHHKIGIIRFSWQFTVALVLLLVASCRSLLFAFTIIRVNVFLNEWVQIIKKIEKLGGMLFYSLKELNSSRVQHQTDAFSQAVFCVQGFSYH